ncbi:MAG TPA: hypothetical protein VI111_04935 [Thermoleophilaceae bacterium]
MPQEPRLIAALQLGWRVTELYALVDDLDEPVPETLLPFHDSLAEEDQLELQVRAAAGDARRAGLSTDADALERLVAVVRQVPSDPDTCETFRAQLRDCHISLETRLWADDEAAGKAYELGTGISDTYGRIYQAYRYPHADAGKAWADVFCEKRVEQLKKLLDDLQTRLDPASVTVVRDHLDSWRARVEAYLNAAAALPDKAETRLWLRRQTVIWRQLLTGAKQPEAFLGAKARAEVRGELMRLAWRRYRVVLPFLAVLLFAVIASLSTLESWYHDGGEVAVSALIAIAGALGITQASALLTVRQRAKQWSELLWDRALAHKIRDHTLCLDYVFPPPKPLTRGRLPRAGWLSGRSRRRGSESTREQGVR